MAGGGLMKDFLKTYKMKLTTVGPVFIGSGREINKKEYVSYSRDKSKFGIVNIEKLYSFFRKKGLGQEFEEFILNGKEDLNKWLYKHDFRTSDISECMRYELSCTNYNDDKGTRLQIMEFVKDAYGMPYIPGTSLKGMFRTIFLAADIIDSALGNREKYKQDKGAFENAVKTEKGKSMLNREMQQLEGNYYRRLNRPETKPNDAVNDIMSGFVVSDSAPLKLDDIVLCQKIERHTDGTEKKLNLLRECIKPGTDIYFNITVDESICSFDKDDIFYAVQQFNECYNKCFVSKFKKMELLKDDYVILGGGSGFVSKTIIYPLFVERIGLDMARDIFMKTGVPREHKHNLDGNYGVSPHIIKCTKYQDNTMQMGLCRLECEA